MRMNRAIPRLRAANGIGEPLELSRLRTQTASLVRELQRPGHDAADANVELWPIAWAPRLGLLCLVISLLVTGALVALVVGVIALVMIADVPGAGRGFIAVATRGTLAT